MDKIHGVLITDKHISIEMDQRFTFGGGTNLFESSTNASKCKRGTVRLWPRDSKFPCHLNGRCLARPNAILSTFIFGTITSLILQSIFNLSFFLCLVYQPINPRGTRKPVPFP